jgi:hypothetical protein
MTVRELLLILLAVAPPLAAQAGSAELSGHITDPSNLAVVKARVQAEDQATMARFTVLSDERGSYHLLGLPAGSYVLTVEQPGFRTFRQSGVNLRLGDHTAIDIKLLVGQASETVEVKAAAPLLETATGSVGFTVGHTRVEALPLDGRNFVPLVALSPGVALPGGGSVLPRINGSRPRTNEYVYDGISVLQPEPGQVAFYPIIDGIDEFKLNINSYSPEYGRSNGGTIIVATRSGSNELHGTLFEFLRNEDLNARNFFAPNGAKPEFRRNQFGFAAGGPIQRNRTFYFVDYQGTRLRTGITRLSTVPTLAQRQGIFSTAVLDPTTRQPFANNTVPLSRFDSIAQQVLTRYPAPTTGGTANNYVRTAAEPDQQDQFDIRLDRYFGRHRVFGRYSFLRDDDDPVTPLPDGSGTIGSGVTGHAITRGDGVVAEYDWTRSANALNTARFGFTRRDLNQTPLAAGGIAVPGIPSNSFASTLPVFAVSGYQQIGPPAGSNDRFTTSVTEYQDTYSLVDGRHTVKFGFDIRREALDVLNPSNPAGSYSFTAAGTGDPVASLLLGQVNSFSIDIQGRPLQERAHIAEFFAGDEWHVSPRLSVNLGTRYTLNFPSTEVHDQGAVFNLKTQVLGFPHTARELECCDFGPRVGMAYRGGNTWVLRSGYGMIWFEQSGITTPFTIPQFPFVETLGLASQDNIAPAFVLAGGPNIQVTPPGANSGLGQGVFGVDRHNGSGYSQQWNFTVQKTFGANLNLEVGYLGSKNTRLGVPDANINQLPSADLAMGSALLTKVANPYYGQIPATSSLGAPTIAAAQLLRPFPRFTNVALFRDNMGNSTYHAIEAKLEKRLSRGLTFTFAYTFSKLIDDASSVFSTTVFTGPIANTGVADAYNRHLEKSLSNGDIPRIFAAGWVYELPRWWRIGGWRVGGIVRLQSGDMVTVSQATNLNSNLGFGTQRPNEVGDPNSLAGRSVAQWFSKAAFTQAGQFVIGNSPRNPVRGPGLQEADLMLSKSFSLSERARMEFRAEVFNVSNTPPFNDPNGSFGSPAFGTVSSAGNPRDFEAALKLHF